MKLRSKIVEIEAVLWEGTEDSVDIVEDFAGRQNVFFEDGVLTVWNELEKQWINCPDGHYVLKGLKGEFYPCEPEALWMKYEVIDG